MLYSQPFLDRLPLWVLFVATVLLFVSAVEVGFRIGRFGLAGRGEEAQKTQVAPIMGASLGLLAFFLAFTFNMAGSRFDARKKVVLEEANVVETAYLRSQLLPEPHRTEFQDLLRKYVDVRVQVRSANIETIQHVVTKSEELHGLLWSRLATFLEKSPPSAVTGLFVRSLNDIVDLHRKRVTVGVYNRIPVAIFFTVYVVALLSMGMMGYHAGLAGKRSFIANLLLITAFAAVLLLITDLDRPGQKLFGVSQQTMVDLQSRINRTP